MFMNRHYLLFRPENDGGNSGRYKQSDDRCNGYFQMKCRCYSYLASKASRDGGGDSCGAVNVLLQKRILKRPYWPGSTEKGYAAV